MQNDLRWYAISRVGKATKFHTQRGRNLESELTCDSNCAKLCMQPCGCLLKSAIPT